MLKVSKLADYATLIMVYMAKNWRLMHNARDIAQHTHIALPTISKLLKQLARQGLLISQRGAHGGYSLVRHPKDISVAAIIAAIDGDFGVVDCSHAQGQCYLEPICSISTNWRLISQTIFHALECLSLEAMAKPLAHTQLNLKAKAFIQVGVYNGNRSKSS